MLRASVGVGCGFAATVFWEDLDLLGSGLLILSFSSASGCAS
jgi:hypothetical protein